MWYWFGTGWRYIWICRGMCMCVWHWSIDNYIGLPLWYIYMPICTHHICVCKSAYFWLYLLNSPRSNDTSAIMSTRISQILVSKQRSPPTGSKTRKNGWSQDWSWQRQDESGISCFVEKQDSTRRMMGTAANYTPLNKIIILNPYWHKEEKKEGGRQALPFRQNGILKCKRNDH